MAHLRSLFIGSRNDLQRIYDNAPDSSSESAAEMTIWADWIDDYDTKAVNENFNGEWNQSNVQWWLDLKLTKIDN